MKKIWTKYEEQIRYIFFGILTTLVNWIIYTFTIRVLSVNVFVANVLAWVIAVLFAYITNKLFVFKSRKEKYIDLFKEILKFFLSRILSGIVEILGFPLLYYIGVNQSFFGIDGFFAKAFISIIVVILNYLFGKILVFNN